jgi:hypothetical protein
LKVVKLRLLVLLITVKLRLERIPSTGGMLADKGKPNYSDKSMSQCYFVNYHVIATGLGSKAELQAKNPDTKLSDPRDGLSANNI